MFIRFSRLVVQPIVALCLFLALGCQGTGIPGGGVVDSDGDGFSDKEERDAEPGSDPFNPDDTPDNPIDSDGDGCSDFDEVTFEDFCDGNPNTGGGGDGNVFSLRVARHVDQPVSAADVDSIFREAGELLQTVQLGCGDLAADVAFVREGAIETFDRGDAVVTTDAELDRLFALPQDFIVVNEMIGVCGAAPSDMTTLLGCSFADGSVVIIADAPPDVWAHEWGHVQGLSHRNDCDSNIMHSTELFTDSVNQRERRAFLAPGPRAKRAIHKTRADKFSRDSQRSASLGRLERTSDEHVNAWIDRLVTRRYRAGAPSQLVGRIKVEELSAIRYSVLSAASPIQRLRVMLVDPAFADYRANIARVLGLAGEVDAVPALMASVVTADGALSREQFNGRVEALLALGRLAAADPTGAALEFLIRGTDPQSWSDWNVAWSYGRYQNDTLHVLLAKLSVMALGLSQHDASLAHLRGLRERIDAGLVDAAKFADQVDEAVARFQGLEPKSTFGVTRQP